MGVQHQPLHIDAGQVDLVGAQLADLDYLLHLGHADPSRLGAERVEVTRGLVEHQVARPIRSGPLDEGQVRRQGVLHHIPFAVELAGLLAFRNQGAVTGAGEEGGDAGAAGPQLLRQRPLGGELQLQLAGQVLALELLVAPHVGGDHLPDLAAMEQRPEAELIHPAIVADDGEAALAALAQRLDKLFGNAAQAEDPRGDGDVVLHQIAKGGLGAGINLVHKYLSALWLVRWPRGRLLFFNDGAS